MFALKMVDWFVSFQENFDYFLLIWIFSVTNEFVNNIINNILQFLKISKLIFSIPSIHKAGYTVNMTYMSPRLQHSNWTTLRWVANFRASNSESRGGVELIKSNWWFHSMESIENEETKSDVVFGVIWTELKKFPFHSKFERLTLLAFSMENGIDLQKLEICIFICTLVTRSILGGGEVEY